MKPKPRKRKARRDGRQADGSIRFTMTEAINKEALRNVMVFGPPFGGSILSSLAF